ncbi:unnamed protein product [Peronospora belbahrii]|uniref:Uncharacterized protein n=1 Tax=Peronospora belbahrii TaxID=622444 RepID=A0AAU9LGX2_9STRA|nr:unnamed protein product [Peronospora belbahrii]CAH0517259.1 unnamed protein product [Peronospora belbahrii]
MVGMSATTTNGLMFGTSTIDVVIKRRRLETVGDDNFYNHIGGSLYVFSSADTVFSSQKHAITISVPFQWLLGAVPGKQAAHEMELALIESNICCFALDARCRLELGS